MMVHVNVGLANCIMGLLNAAAENIPLVMIAGRTPLTEHQRLGSRMSPIQYGQEMRDQSAMIRELVQERLDTDAPRRVAGRRATVSPGVGLGLERPADVRPIEAAVDLRARGPHRRPLEIGRAHV